MTDRDETLLELAAKAAGLSHPDGVYWARNDAGDSWNPLTDDGDALRLAVKLNLLTTECVEDWKWCRDKVEHADVCASYRRAITRAAAEIGAWRMTGFDSKRQMAQAKLDDDDDTQVYADTLLIVYQRGFADGKAAQRQWVGLTNEEIAEILCDDRWQMRPELMLLACQAKLKEKNT